jgi:Na+/H+ antiporter NhaD/arsenite permease-like protein
MILIFVVGYLMIILEHPLQINKAASALLTGVFCWTALVFGQETLFGSVISETFIEESFLHHVGEIAEILFFLLGAMTIVELIDAHEGFEVITKFIATRNKIKLLWLICIVTFFLSALLDNLTTSIVIAALLKKLIHDREDLWFFAGMVIIAANAGGAWSPIGDVTTIMLWIGGQVTSGSIVSHLFIPSLVCMVVPLIIVSMTKKGNLAVVIKDHSISGKTTNSERQIVLVIGILGLLFVPLFKSITHLPPFMGILFSLGVLWIITEFMHKRKSASLKGGLVVTDVIRRIDTPSVLFFLGILLAVASLQTAGQLTDLAQYLDVTIGNIYVINICIGLFSAIVDNVPLVAGAMGMYPLSTYGQDHVFWQLLAYCAGTGGSALIIGSAAGVAIMGILKIDFIWYVKRISGLAIIGYFAGALTFVLLN